jgi:GIY-YIG catalytic domain
MLYSTPVVSIETRLVQGADGVSLAKSKPYGIIYRITHKESGKVYIGQSIHTVEKRWKAHLADAKKGTSMYFYNALRKYGQQAFDVEEIDAAFSREELNDMEGYWIRFYNSMNPDKGYNLREGGHMGYNYSLETRKRMGDVQTRLRHEGKVKYTNPPRPTEEQIIQQQIQYSRCLVHCVDTGEIYLSIRDAHRATGINRKMIMGCLNGDRYLTAGGYRWEGISKESVADLRSLIHPSADLPIKLHKTNKRRIKCLQTGVIFDCMADAARSVDLSLTHFASYVKMGKQVKGYSFEILDPPSKAYLRLDLAETRKQLRLFCAASKHVKCLETGETWQSATLAAESIHSHRGALCTSIRKDKTHKGLHYAYLPSD